jgi:hypothetical protein
VRYCGPAACAEPNPDALAALLESGLPAVLSAMTTVGNA